ncbi:hypothetical protein CASFOL_007413 [Castilleja foliolosa]|uniref:Pectin acetylesterase n=1 Tax=Castilleja foliolosa TaxID=1961234 RepID=A0ABD3ECZ8_9LAMI
MAGHWLQQLILALLVLNIGVNGEGINPIVNITILDNALAIGAVCLDGSPAGYHYSEGFGEGVNNWLVYLPIVVSSLTLIGLLMSQVGGGWCDTTSNCIDRVKKQPIFASTNNITSTSFGGILSPNQTINPDFYNWNKVSLRYCDGSSFIGDVEAVDPATNLHYRGSRIFSGIVNELLAKGLNKAQNVILAGTSAGGLATILNCDRFRAFVPNATRVKCVSDSGFFVYAKNLTNDVGFQFDRVVELHGVAKFLPTSCTSRMDSGSCFFPQNLVGDIQTPLFLLNSAFDRYQISVNLKPNPAEKPGWVSCTNHTETCTPAQLQTIKNFRDTFLETLKNVSDSPSRGLFINSCYIHDYVYSTERWNYEGSPRLDNKTIAQAIGDWYFDRSSVRLIDTKTEYPLDCHVL